MSVADLVQRHTGSRPDLTPVPPDQLRQNSVMTGRRARQDDQPIRPTPAPPQPPIAAALDGADHPADRRVPQPAPRDEAAARPGGTSSYFTIPSEAIRSSFSSDPAVEAAPEVAPDLIPPDGGFAPTEVPPPPPITRHPRRPVGESSGPRNGFPRDEAARHPDDPSASFPVDAPVDGPRKRPRRVRGSSAPIPGEGFPPNADAPRPGRRRAGEASAHHPVPGGPVPGDDPFNAFAPEGGRRVGEDPRNGFPADAPHRNGTRRPGEMPGDPRNGFAPDAPGGRRAGEASAHFPVDAARNGFPADAPQNGRHGMGTGHFPVDARNGFPEADAPAHHAADDPRNGFAPDAPGGRRAGEASAHFPVDVAQNGFSGDDPRNQFPPDGPRRNGARRADHPGPGEGFPPDAEAGRRNGARRGRRAPAPVDGFFQDGFPPDPESAHRNGARRTGEAHHPVPGDGFPPDPDARHNGARGVGEASTHHPVPGEGFPPDPEPLHRNGARRAGEASALHPVPGEGFPPDPDAPRRNGVRGVGEASAHHPVPGEGFPPDPEAPRRGRRGAEGFPGDARRVGEASEHFGDPGEPPHGRAPRRPGETPHGEGSGPRGFPPEAGRPESAARRRAVRTGAPQPEPGRFPTDTPPLPQPGQASGPFPVDDFRRDEQQPPEAKPRRSTGVPSVPLPPPRRDDEDLVSMTTEMEAIGEEVQKRRSIDHTLARFSAVHDEIKAEEREKKAKRRKLRPWERDDEMDRLDELEAQQSMAMAVPNLDQLAEEDEQKGKKKRRWRKGKNAGKAFTIVIAALVFMSTAVLWGFKSYIESSAQTVDALDPNSDAIKDAAAQTGDENFLLVGSDTRAGAAAEEGVGNENTVQGARSDTVMIAHIPKNRERVVVVSFPRDLEVTRPACEGWDPKTGKYTGEQHPEAKRVKLNTAYQIGGPKCVTKMVQELSGLAVNHFVGIDFHGFKDMVEAVQGVEVCVERPLDDEVLGMVVPEAGKNVRLTGDQALNFVRARHVKGDPTSDYGRITRQQRFLSSLLRKAMSSEVLLNPGKLTKFVDAFSKATFGDNIGIEQLFTLGQSMQGVDAGRVTFITVPTVGEANKRGNEELRTEDTNALFEAIRQDTPLPGESPASQTEGKGGAGTQTQAGLMQAQQGQVDPKTIKIQVLNGGNETGGIAGDTADKLAEHGFEIVRTGSTEPVNTTVIKHSRSRAAQAKTVQAAVPGATLVEDPSMSGAILLIIGPEFDGKVQSPTGGEGQKAELPENLSTVNAGDVSCA